MKLIERESESIMVLDFVTQVEGLENVLSCNRSTNIDLFMRKEKHEIEDYTIETFVTAVKDIYFVNVIVYVDRRMGYSGEFLGNES